jgi:outer membrane protein assembly factor BamB
MVHETPAWRYQTQHTITLGYGHVHLLPNHVLGQWFCVEREGGRVLWDRKVSAADSVIGVSEGVVIASETRMSGPCTYTFGVFAVSLDTGELLWTSHTAKGGTRGFAGALLSWFGIANEDHATGVRGSECITAVGRVMDIHTGKEVRRVTPTEDWPAFWKATSPARALYERHPVDCGSGRILRHGLPGAPKKVGGFPDGTFNLFLSDAEGRALWSFDIANSGYHIRGNYFSYRYSNGCVYMMVSDRPQSVPIDPRKPLFVKDNPAQYFLWVLDVDTGQVCQKIRVTEAEATHCRIEDVDDRAVLVSCDGLALLFTRQEKARG